MKSEIQKASDLVSMAAPYNPRKITAAQARELARAMKTFGDLSGVVVNLRTGRLVGGHQRVKAFAPDSAITKAPAPDSVGTVNAGTIATPYGPWVYREVDWPEEKERLANIAANKHGGLFDEDLLAPLMKELLDAGSDMALTGFTTADLEKFLLNLQREDASVEQPAPPPPDVSVTRRGDLILLGEHRLLCGDSASREDVDRLLDGQAMDLVVTDPPYNVLIEPRSNNAIQKNLAARRKGKAMPRVHKEAATKMRAKDRPIQNDAMAPGDYARVLSAWFGNLAYALKPGGAFYIWGGYVSRATYPAPLAEHGLVFAQGIIWDKQVGILTRKDFMGAHEEAYYGWKAGGGHYFTPSVKNATTVWAVKKVASQSMVHLTEKPVELATRALTYSSRSGERVLDLFAGSGSALMACEQLGRRAYLMEIDEAYCDVIVERWEQATRRKAVRP